MNFFKSGTYPKLHNGRLVYIWVADSFFERLYLAWTIFIGSLWMLRTGEVVAWSSCIEHSDKLRAALQKAVDDYGKPGGPWNVPSEPGTWLQMAKDALGGE